MLNKVWHGLVDDAGLFPPTALDMTDAVRRHREDLRTGHPVHTGRFLCPLSRLPELRGRLLPGERFRVGVICDRLPEGDELRTGGAGVDIAMVETPASGDLERTLAAVAGPSVPVFVEYPRDAGWLDAVAGLAGPGRPGGAKVRCGGVRPELFPSADELAAFIAVCAAHELPFKATAGLHHAVRHTDPATGFTHHGFANVVLASCAAASGAGRGELAGILESADAAGLAARARDLSDTRAAAGRRLLYSYGSCDTRAPITDLRDLGLLDDPITRDTREKA